ncbi:MAG: aspartate ammonia-lyase [Chloroflexi bacterium]|nr:aspartate ammonia-lyase [Chloroflexota bacterium]
MTKRVEKDSLGSKEIPEDAYWGVQTQRAVENFPISGLKPYPAFIWSMDTIKRAAAEVNMGLGLLDKKIGQAIAQAAQEIIEGKWWDHFVVDPYQAGAGTSHNMNTNEVIANRAIELLGGKKGDYSLVHPNDHVNMSQSTNDTIPTAIRLGCLWRLPELLSSLDDLADALEEKSREFDTVIKSGRTHLMDAVPIRLGQEFSGYAQAIRHDRERIAAAEERLKRLGIGGTAVGTGLNAHPEFHSRMIARLSQLTGIELRSSGNLFESMQSMSDPLDFSASLRTLAATLGRIANDFRLLASGPATGLDEMRLPAVQPGSSIMPGKVNPVMAEMLNMVCFQVMGNDLTVMMSAQAGQLELNVMMPVIAHNLFGSMHILINAIGVFTERCVRGIQANPEKARDWLEKNAILVTALNPVIGYAKGAEVVKEAMATGKTIRQVVLEKGLVEEKELDKILDVRRMTEPGIIKDTSVKKTA